MAAVLLPATSLFVTGMAEKPLLQGCVCFRCALCCATVQATADLNAQLQAAGHHRQQVAALQQSERELQDQLQQQEAAATQQEACAAQQAQQVGR